MNWNSKKVLVTGAGGFIGSHLCEALVQTGAHVTAMIRYSGRADWGNLELAPLQVRSALKVVAGNIEDTEFVLRQMKDTQVVFHLAALIAIPYSYVAPRSYITTNVLGTLNILEAARTCGVEKVVHTSTSETIANRADGWTLAALMTTRKPEASSSPIQASFCHPRPPKDESPNHRQHRLLWPTPRELFDDTVSQGLHNVSQGGD